MRLKGRHLDGADSIVAFVHIPKTAGGTVKAMLAATYGDAAIGRTGNYLTDSESSERKVMKRSGAGWEAWHRAGGRMVVGHTPYGAFREAFPPGTRYITFLREPVDRVLSHYHRHIRRKDPRRAGSPKDLAKKRVKANSLREALDLRTPALTNLATRFLCDDPSLSRELSESDLDEAKANLREFAFVGIQERFGESVASLQRALDLDLVPLVGQEDRHVSIDRPTIEQIPDGERALIEEHNRLDRELYAFALALFEDALRR